ncbi:hypothetical protein Hanom_Chr09g00824701 [Helianthus anomalus]
MARFKRTETSFEVFSLRLTRRTPRGEPRCKPEAKLKINIKNIYLIKIIILTRFIIKFIKIIKNTHIKKT